MAALRATAGILIMVIDLVRCENSTNSDLADQFDLQTLRLNRSKRAG